MFCCFNSKSQQKCETPPETRTRTETKQTKNRWRLIGAAHIGHHVVKLILYTSLACVQTQGKSNRLHADYKFPRIIVEAIISFFGTERGRLFQERRLIKWDDYFKFHSTEIVFLFVTLSHFRMIMGFLNALVIWNMRSEERGKCGNPN